MKQKAILLVVILLLLAGGAWLVSKNSSPGKYDSFAQCLTDSGAKMYGAFWCPHCKAQKEEFGKSWQYVDYVECSTADGNGQLKTCTDANITGYPTWEFADGERLEGAVPFTTLAEKTGCQI
jgi:hypothetical protein